MSLAIQRPASFLQIEENPETVTVTVDFRATLQKIKEEVLSPLTWVGVALGACAFVVYGPLTSKILTVLGVSAGALADPFAGMGLGTQILLAPFICVLAPVIEEVAFRGGLQEVLKNKIESIFTRVGRLSEAQAKIAARITAVFFSSVLFGLIHFSNALVFWCNPVLFLPQVVAATLMGLIFGAAKEFSGSLNMPIGMHIGNNTLAWANYMI